MTRSHGRSPKGERLRMGFPHGHRKTTAFVAGLRMSGMIAPMVLDGPLNGDWFEAYVGQVLAPELRRGDIVIMDTLSSHKRASVRERSKRQAQPCASCRPTAPTSIPSKRPSRASRLCFERSAHSCETIASAATCSRTKACLTCRELQCSGLRPLLTATAGGIGCRLGGAFRSPGTVSSRRAPLPPTTSGCRKAAAQRPN